MTKIRLSRKGRHKLPFFHILVVNGRAKRDSGNFIEKLGFYDPTKITNNRADKITIQKDRYDYWIKTGAQPSKFVEQLVQLVSK